MNVPQAVCKTLSNHDIDTTHTHTYTRKPFGMYEEEEKNPKNSPWMVEIQEKAAAASTSIGTAIKSRILFYMSLKVIQAKRERNTNVLAVMVLVAMVKDASKRY